MSTLDSAEVRKFSELAQRWWDETGPFAPLHRFNPTRLRYLRDKITQHFSVDAKAAKPLAGLRCLDVGCGGGLLAEPLARLGATVLGIDAGEANIEAARHHASQTGLEVNYRASTVEDLAKEAPVFDVVLAMEILEHVADVPLFLRTLSQLVAPGGLLCVATLNRTPQAFLKAIIGAEYVLRWLPRGTHDWKRFCKPAEIASILVAEGLEINSIDGVSYSIISQRFALSSDLSVNYMLLASRG